jgi:hypothetical protein
MVKYGLKERKSGKLLGFTISGNAEGSEVHLDTYSDYPWLVDTKERAAWVKSHSTEWYNSCKDTPTHTYASDDLMVVEITMEVRDADCDVLDDVDVFSLKYKEKEPGHLEYLKKRMAEGEQIRCSFYDIEELAREGKRVLK